MVTNKSRKNCHSLRRTNDLQFGYEHFHLFESEEAFLRFCSINL
jgi:hypothetical protein